MHEETLNNYKLQLRLQVDDKLNKTIDRFYQEVPMGTYQRDSEEIDLEYYTRHSIETILRIRHKRMVDSLVTHYFIKHHQMHAAKLWAEYTEDEMLHGHMFAKDLEKLTGITIDDVYKHTPLFSTQLLNGYFYFTLEHEGPMASIISAYFLEYTTRKTQPEWLDNLSKIFGKQNVKGARVHVNHDIKDNHSEFVWEVLMSMVHSEEDGQRLLTHLDRIYGLFAAYFVDVYQSTIGKRQAIKEKIIPVVAVNAH